MESLAEVLQERCRQLEELAVDLTHHNDIHYPKEDDDEDEDEDGDEDGDD